MFRMAVQGPHADLTTIFKEHSELSSEEAEALAQHASILFLLGTIKDKHALSTVNIAISQLVAGGALGVVFEHCGAAYTSAVWQDSFSEVSLEPWLNWIHGKGDLRTLGLEIFGLPDLVVQSRLDDESKQELLIEVAESMFLDEVPMLSGHIVEASDGGEYTLQKEAKAPYAKGHPNFNTKGCLRLVPIKSLA